MRLLMNAWIDVTAQLIRLQFLDGKHGCVRRAQDEVFHVAQTAAFCRGEWGEWRSLTFLACKKDELQIESHW